jgi:hypothetical protein
LMTFSDDIIVFFFIVFPASSKFVQRNKTPVR